MFRIFSVCFFVLLFTSGCKAPPQQEDRSLSFAPEAFLLQVSNITLQEPASHPAEDIQYQYQMPMTLTDGVKLWARERLESSGSAPDQLVVTIRKATISREVETTPQEWWELTSARKEIFTADLAVTLAILAPNGRKLAVANSEGHHKVTIPGDVDMSRRDALLNNLYVRTLQDMDLNFSRAIPEYMAAHLING